MKFLANENFPLESVHLLHEFGYDISAVSWNRAGITDEAVIELANAEQRIIITFDRDYGELVFRRGFKTSTGIVFLRMNDFQPGDPAILLHHFLSTQHIMLEGYFTVVEPEGIRQRKLPTT